MIHLSFHTPDLSNLQIRQDCRWSSVWSFMIDCTCRQRWKGSSADFKGEVGAADFSPCGFQLILWWKFFQVVRHLTFFFFSPSQWPESGPGDSPVSIP